MSGIKLIEGDDKARAEKCLVEIRQIAEMYDCVIVPKLTIMANGMIDGGIVVFPKKREPKES